MVPQWWCWFWVKKYSFFICFLFSVWCVCYLIWFQNYDNFQYWSLKMPKGGDENSRFTFCVQNAGDSGLLTHPRWMEYKRIWTFWSTHQIGPKNHFWDVFQSTKTAWQLWHLVTSIGHDLPIDTKVWPNGYGGSSGKGKLCREMYCKRLDSYQ